MKKILLVLMALLYVSTVLVAEIDLDNPDYQTDGNLDFEKLLADPDVEEADLIPIILDGDQIDDISFGEVLEPLDPDSEQALRDQLAEDGYDLDVIDDAVELTNRLGEGETLGEIKEEDEELFNNVEDAIIDAIASQAADTLMSQEQRDDMTDILNLVNSALNVLNGFAQSTANTSISSSLFGYQDYKIFNVAIGSSFGLAVPDPYDTTMDIMEISESDEMLEELEDLGIEAGFSVQAFSASVGVNLNFLVENLYAGVVFGSTAIQYDSIDSTLTTEVLGIPVYSAEVEADSSIEDLALTVDMESSIFGVKANYQILDGFGVPILFRWNGVNLGTGFIHTSQNIKTFVDMSPSLELDPGTLGAKFDILSDTYTIPLEASTGIQLLSILTITAGGGIDVQFGSSEVSMDIVTAGDDSIGTKIIRKTLDEIMSESAMTFPYNSDGTPDLFNPRVNVGVGFGIGPVAFDVSAFYFFNTGLSLGANFVIRI